MARVEKRSYITGMVARSRSMVVRVSDKELAMVHAVAEDRHEAVSTLFRRWLVDTYRARFGEAMPPAVRLKFGEVIDPSK